MRVGPTFAFVLGCPAECGHGLPPEPMCVLFQGVSAISCAEKSDQGWEPGETGIGSYAQSIYRVAERSREGIEFDAKILRESGP